MRRADLIYFLAWSAVACCSIVVPLFAKDLGASHMMIGLIVGGYGITNLIAFYLFGRWADMYDRKSILSFGLLSAAIIFSLQTRAYDTHTLFVVRAAAGFSIGIFPAAIMAYAFQKRKGMGVFSSYGSLGWAFGYIVSALLKDFNLIFAYTGVVLFVAFLISLSLEKSRVGRLNIPLFPIRIFLKNKGIYLPFLLRHSGANMVWVFLPIFFSGLGASFTVISILYLFNMGTQFLVMQRVDRYDNRKLIGFGLLATAVVFMGYFVAKSFWQVIPFQILLGVAWSSIYVGSLNTLMEGNRQKATVAGMLNSCQGFSQVFGPLVGGVVAQYYGMKMVFVAAALFSIAAYATANFNKQKKK